MKIYVFVSSSDTMIKGTTQVPQRLKWSTKTFWKQEDLRYRHKLFKPRTLSNDLWKELVGPSVNIWEHMNLSTLKFSSKEVDAGHGVR